jgi:hypothetical protein
MFLACLNLVSPKFGVANSVVEYQDECTPTATGSEDPLTAGNPLDHLRAAYPEWLVWRTGIWWWAKKRESELSARARDLETLATALSEHHLHDRPRTR